MANTRSIDLGEHLEAFVQRLVDSGRYASASDVVREALRCMAAREQARAELERLLDEGIASAESGRLRTDDEVWEELRAEFPWIE